MISPAWATTWWEVGSGYWVYRRSFRAISRCPHTSSCTRQRLNVPTIRRARRRRRKEWLSWYWNGEYAVWTCRFSRRQLWDATIYGLKGGLQSWAQVLHKSTSTWNVLGDLYFNIRHFSCKFLNVFLPQVVNLREFRPFLLKFKIEQRMFLRKIKGIIG